MRIRRGGRYVPYTQSRISSVTLTFQLATRRSLPRRRSIGSSARTVVDAVLLGERPPQAVEVAGVVGQRGRFDVELEGAHRRVLSPVAGERQRLGLGDGVAVRPHRLAAALGHLDLRRAPHVGLAGHGPAVDDLGRGQTGVAAPLDLAGDDAHPAAAAAALPGAGRRHVELAQDGGVEQAGARRDLDRLPRGT